MPRRTACLAWAMWPLNPAILPDGLEQHEYMAICIEMVKMADQLVMLPGWERSAGARAEHALAIKIGKTMILPCRTWLTRWRHDQTTGGRDRNPGH